MRRLLLATATSLLLAAGAAQATTITFDEFPADDANGAFAANRYAALGVTFVLDDDGNTRGGLSNGDPGNWDVDGTNGPIFSGFNETYMAAMLFAGDINGFRLDASRTAGSSDGQTLTVEGYNDGGLVDALTLTLGDINSWSTFSLAGVFDEVRWQGSTGTGFSPFGIDDINWNEGGVVPEPGTWALMILGFGAAGVALRNRRRGVLA